MEICHAHNATRDLTAPKPFGIRVSLRANDSFARLIGPQWERCHWYESEHERDEALRDMASEHRYSRRGDQPTLRFEPVQRDRDG